MAPGGSPAVHDSLRRPSRLLYVVAAKVLFHHETGVGATYRARPTFSARENRDEPGL